jgi:hypothetical protein
VSMQWQGGWFRAMPVLLVKINPGNHYDVSISNNSLDLAVIR